jgi:hypothetical protein
MKLSGKKLFLIGFILILLVGIPLSIYLLQQQQETRTRAQKSTVLKFTPDSSTDAPIQKNIDELIPLDIMVDPGTNLVSFVKLQIQYDSEKLAPEGSDAFVANAVVFPTVLEGPIYSDGKVEVTLSVGPDPTKAIQTLSKAGTLTLKAIANTADGQPTLVTYGISTQVLSIGTTDQASENVLSSSEPATIIIGGAELSGTLAPIPTGTISPTPEISGEPTTEPTDTPLPTTEPTATNTPSPTFGPTPTGTISATAGPNISPVCNSLAVDRATTGIAPFAIVFTASGSDADGTISKVNFNFGDGDISGDITTTGGIGTNSVNVQTSHEYQNAGTYTASAILTDNNSGVSSTDSCQQTIIVQEGSTGGTGGGTPTSTMTPTPTIAATGAFDTALGIGAFAMFLIIGGGLLFFVL